MAQEVKEVLPQLVQSEKEQNSLLSINYGGIIPLLVSSLKQLTPKQELDKRDERIRQLQRQNQTLEARLAKLEAMMVAREQNN